LHCSAAQSYAPTGLFPPTSTFWVSAGAKEYREGRPFVGRAGDTLREWFHCAGQTFDNFRRWNVCIDYHKGNPHPQPLEIERDRAEVTADIVSCQPRVIAAVGIHAAEWCLGRKVRLVD